MNKLKAFFAELNLLNLAVGLLCTYSAVDSGLKHHWVWAAVSTFLAFFNLRIALPPRYRFPKDGTFF